MRNRKGAIAFALLLSLLFSVASIGSAQSPSAAPAPSASPGTDNELVPEIDDRNAQDIANSKVPVLVEVYLPGDPLCEQQADEVKAIALVFRGKIRCLRIDGRANPGLGVMNFPTLILRTPDGHVQVKEGLTGRSELGKWVNGALRHSVSPKPAPSTKP